jgi:CheY-like chemotaxis protein
MPDGGRITIRTRAMPLPDDHSSRQDGMPPGDYAVLSVSDTGIGMDAETQQRVFEPFFTTKPKGQGTGLGLATVYGIVAQHGGSAQVSSELGAGASFDIYLRRTDRSATPESEDEQPTARIGTETILLAEDNEDVRKMIQRVLGSAGYSVLSARHGEEAVGRFTDHREVISLVILDVVMPIMGGKAALDEIRAVAPELPALFVSGYPETGVHESHVLNEGIDLLQKPFSGDKLLETVRSILDRNP